jgi:hypothetical protein
LRAGWDFSSCAVFLGYLRYGTAPQTAKGRKIFNPGLRAFRIYQPRFLSFTSHHLLTDRLWVPRPPAATAEGSVEKYPHY